MRIEPNMKNISFSIKYYCINRKTLSELNNRSTTIFIMISVLTSDHVNALYKCMCCVDYVKSYFVIPSCSKTSISC